jgi:integrative and conjugative element protein (TIGR02256 family)
LSRQPRKPSGGRGRGCPPARVAAPDRPARRGGEAWWQRDPGRLSAELDALAEGGYAPSRDPGAEVDGILRLAVELPIAGRRVPAVVVYPDEYPYFRPYVTAEGLALAHHWSPSSAEVCLLEKAGDAWSTSSTAAGLLDRQWPEVLRLNGLSAAAGDGRPDDDDGGARGAGPPALVAGGGSAPDRPGEVPQAEPWTAYLDKTAPVVVVVPGGVEPPDGVSGGTARLQFRDRDGASRFRRAVAAGDRNPPLGPLPVAVLVALFAGSGEQLWATTDGLVPYEPGERCEPVTLDVAWATLENAPPTANPGSLWAGAAAAGAGRVLTDKRSEAVLVALPEETAQRTVGVGWALLVRSRPHDSAPWSAPAAGHVFRAGANDLRTRAPSLGRMSAKKVLLVGAGGLGSALGAELARTGPETFTVLDGDDVDPAASVRAPSAWRTAGMPKGPAMALLALDATPYTAVEALGPRLGAPRLGPAAAGPDQFWATWQAVLDADVVVDATADFGVQHILRHVRHERDRVRPRRGDRRRSRRDGRRRPARRAGRGRRLLAVPQAPPGRRDRPRSAGVVLAARPAAGVQRAHLHRHGLRPLGTSLARRPRRRRGADRARRLRDVRRPRPRRVPARARRRPRPRLMDGPSADGPPRLRPPGQARRARRSMSTAWIDAAALDQARHHAHERHPLETGGLLLGWTDDATGDAVVADIIGPGPAADHRRTSFLPDNDWQRAELARRYAASGRLHGYLGDWHTTPTAPDAPASATGGRSPGSPPRRSPAPPGRCS